MSKFDNLLPHFTVRLVVFNKGEVISRGTGFYYFFEETFTDGQGNVNDDGSATLGIVTNKHVIENADEIEFHYSYSLEGIKGYYNDKIKIKLDEDSVINHPDSNIDLSVIMAKKLVEIVREKNQLFYFMGVTKAIRISEEELSSMETIQNLIMVGYPNGIWDEINNLPIMRQGVNATPLYQDYMGSPMFAVDIAVYPGSSGSPVFIYDKGTYLKNNEIKFGNRYKFVGIISQGPMNVTNINEEVAVREMLHIGFAIKASELDVFEDLISKHYGRWS